MQKLLVILGAGLLFSACTSPFAKVSPQSNIESGASSQAGLTQDKLPTAEQKRGETSKTGLITQANGQFLLSVAGQQPEIIESYAVDLSAYVGQTVTVTGQYSGDTLFVGKIQ